MNRRSLLLGLGVLLAVALWAAGCGRPLAPPLSPVAPLSEATPASRSEPAAAPLVTARPTAPPPLTVSPPAVSAPTVSAPTVSAPTVSAPTVSAPTVSAPTASAPTVSAPTVSAPPRSLPTAVPAVGSAFSLGVPAGDVYSPIGLAVDNARELAYVLGAASPGRGGPAISVVELARGEVLRRIPLSLSSPLDAGSLLLAPDGVRGYVMDTRGQRLFVLDLLSGTTLATRPVDHPRQAALSADAALLFVLGDHLSALRTSDWSEAWRAEGGGVRLAASAGRLLVARAGSSAPLQVYDAATGQPGATAALPDYADCLAPGPDGGWAVRLSGLTSQVLRLDAQLKVLATVVAPSGSGLFYDAPRQRYLVSGTWAGAGRPVILALDQADLATQREQIWPGDAPPELYAAAGSDRLLAAARYGASQLYFLDPASLQPAAQTIVGVRLQQMVLDEGDIQADVAGVFYIADDQGWIHRVSAADGWPASAWPGVAPMALDAANHRLYVNTGRAADGVVALDSRTGDVVARYPTSGVVAADPRRDRVYIVRGGVLVYDRVGQRVGRLEATFPIPGGLSPNPYAFGARVNPVNGVLAVFMNNGVPGSNNASFLHLYPPGNDQPAAPSGNGSSLFDVAFDSATGRVYVSYSPAKNLEGLQALDASGKPAARLNGRFGHLGFDPVDRLLYVAQGGALARVQPDTLALVGLFQAPQQVDQVLLAPSARRIYYLSQDSPALAFADLESLPPLRPGPEAPAPLPSVEIAYLLTGAKASSAAPDVTETLLIAGADGALYRSQDGTTWQKLSVGSVPIMGQPAVTAGGVLFYAGVGQAGGDGVWRSRSAGDSWELLAQGLTDLRAVQPILARSADEAYFVGRTGGIFAWRPAQAQWERIFGGQADTSSPGARPGALPGTLSLAPDGTLFLLSYDGLRRSADGGRTWRDLPRPPESGQILGFSSTYTETQTVFGLFDIAQPRLWRSEDGGLTWNMTDAPLWPSAYSTLLVTRGETIYLYQRSYDAGSPADRASALLRSVALLLRSRDGGDLWEAADPAATEGSTAFAVAPDGRLWFGVRGGVAAADADRITWTAAQPAAEPTPPPTLAPAGSGGTG